MQGATVWVCGELDLATADRLEKALEAALLEAAVVVLDLSAVTFMDMAGRHAIVAGARRAERERRRLVVLHAPSLVQQLLDMTNTPEHIHVLDVVAASRQVPQGWGEHPVGRQAAPTAERSIEPLRNPVNDSVIPARVMAVHDRRLLLHGIRGEVLRAWKPTGADRLVPAGALVEVYLDAEGEVNGWRSPASGLAINQRRFSQASASTTTKVMVCQDECRVKWVAPAAEQLEKHNERCLTCGGTLAAA